MENEKLGFLLSTFIAVTLTLFVCAILFFSTTLFSVMGDKHKSHGEETLVVENVLNGQELMTKSDCFICHKTEGKLIGPSFVEIAEKYEDNSENVSLLVRKIKLGGSGTWGDAPMTAHPQLERDNVKAMLQWIFDLKGKTVTASEHELALHPVGFGDVDPVKKGEQILNTQCAPCHQTGGVGKIGVAPSIRNRDFLALASDDFIKETIRRGREGTSMVPRPDLSEEDLDAVVAYLRSSWIPLPLDIKVDPSVKYSGDPQQGHITYQTYCASCHGENGDGYISGGVGPGIGLKGFLNVASDDYIFKTVENGRVGTAMRAFVGSRGLANLEKEDVYNIISFLREQASKNESKNGR